MNDEQIIQLFFTRNEDAIRQTDDRYGAKLTRLSENIVGSREDAQECVNDTYFKAWDTIPPTKPVHFFAYLAKICRHQETDVRSAEISRLVGSFLWKQTADNRMIFVRRYWFGDSVSEIALRYEISQSAVLMRLSRMREKLAVYLKKEGFQV